MTLCWHFTWKFRWVLAPSLRLRTALEVEVSAWDRSSWWEKGLQLHDASNLAARRPHRGGWNPEAEEDGNHLRVLTFLEGLSRVQIS